MFRWLALAPKPCGASSCYDNVENTDIPDYEFIGPEGVSRTTHLHPGRGSIERAIKAVIVDSGTEWRHGDALYIAYRYYFNHYTLPGFESWTEELDRGKVTCGLAVCFGALTHGFDLEEETRSSPPTISPP